MGVLDMWAFLTITACTFIIAVAVHDCVMRYYEYKETKKKMNKFYVTKEIAEKLRAKGYYREYDVTDGWVEGIFYQVEVDTFYLPHIDEVLDWLREEKKIHVLIVPMLNHSSATYHWGCEIYDISRMPETVFYKESLFNISSHNEAVLAGIEYVIDNLI